MTSGPNDPNVPGTPDPGAGGPDPYAGGAPQQGGPQQGGPQQGGPQQGGPAQGGPQYGQPQYGQTPPYGGSQYGQPQYGESQYGQPQYGAPQYGNPQQPPPQFGGQQPYPVGPDSSYQPAGAGRPGELVSRIGARVLDSLIVGVPLFFIGIIFAVIGFSAVINLADTDRSFTFGFWIGSVILSLISFVAWVGYFVWMEANRGQTFGKQICNLRVEGPNGGNPTIEQALKRNAYVVLFAGGSLIGSILAIGSVLGVIGAIVNWVASAAALVLVIVMAVTINSSPTKQGKHDEFAGGTRVVTTR